MKYGLILLIFIVPFEICNGFFMHKENNPLVELPMCMCPCSLIGSTASSLKPSSNSSPPSSSSSPPSPSSSTLSSNSAPSSTVSSAIGPMSTLVVFGGGYEDDGVSPPDDLVGLHKYSTGKVWPQYLADLLNMRLQNYAIAGGKTGMDNILFEGAPTAWGGNTWQVDVYLKKNPKIPENVLIGVATGAINEIDLLVPDMQDNNAIDGMVSRITATLQRLADAGAKVIFVLNLPDKTMAPGLTMGTKVATANGVTETVRQGLKDVVKNHNEKMALALTAINDKNKDTTRTKFIPIDFFSFWKESIEEQTYLTTYGFEPCGDGLSVPGDIYTAGTATPDDMVKYAFYDAWHPASAVHLDMATSMQEVLEVEGIKKNPACLTN